MLSVISSTISSPDPLSSGVQSLLYDDDVIQVVFSCMYVCIHVQLYVCVRIHVHTQLYRSVCVYMCMCMCIEREPRMVLFIPFLSHSENEVPVFWMEEAWKEIVFCLMISFVYHVDWTKTSNCLFRRYFISVCPCATYLCMLCII